MEKEKNKESHKKNEDDDMLMSAGLYFNIGEWVGALFFYSLNFGRKKFNYYYSRKKLKKNIIAGYIIMVVIFLILMILVFYFAVIPLMISQGKSVHQ